MPVITDTQNIMDAALQAYGTLDELVYFATSNGFLLDELPIVGTEFNIEGGRGDTSVIEFLVERDFIYNNAGVEATEFLLANSTDNLIAQLNIKIKYK
jgi:hypothetical protein